MYQNQLIEKISQKILVSEIKDEDDLKSYVELIKNDVDETLTINTLAAADEFIASSSFEHNEIEELTLPTSLRNIGERAFIFNYLETVYIPEGVKFIKKHAFAYNNMKTAEIENIVPLISIHDDAFVNGVGEADIIFSMY